MTRGAQLDLFASTEPEIDFSHERELAARLPASVLLGTSSWSFPGWAGIVYPGRPTERSLAQSGLADYAKYPLFGTVGIDRSYYRPLDRETLERYAEQLPSGFRCVAKVWSEITSAVHPRTREPNPHFFDVELLSSEVLAPLADAFADHLGPLVLELAPRRASELPTPADFARDLDAFLGRLPREFQWVLELRNRELLTPRYLDVLAKHEVGHVLSFWERMPDVGEQLDLPGVLTAPFVVTRLLIPPGRRYDERRDELAPFDHIVDVQEQMRADVVRLVDACEALGKVLWIIVNNKAEGSSPLTVRALAERIAERVPPRAP